MLLPVALSLSGKVRLTAGLGSRPCEPGPSRSGSACGACGGGSTSASSRGGSTAPPVCVSRAAWGHVAGRCRGDDGARRKDGVVCVREVMEAIEPVMSEWRWAKWSEPERQTGDRIPAADVMRALLRYGPGSVRVQLQLPLLQLPSRYE